MTLAENNNNTVTVSRAAPLSLSEIFAIKQANQPVKKPYTLMWELNAIASVALTFIIMSYSSMFSILPILVFYMLWLPQILTKGLVVARPSNDLVFILLLPGLAAMSTLWSDYWSITINKSVEFFSMLLCTAIMARVTSTRGFSKGVMIGVSLTLIATIMDGTYGRDYFTGTYSLVGLFGSKNQVGFTAQIGILVASAMLMSQMKRIEKLTYAIGPLILCIVSLYLSKSATSVITLIAVLGVMFIMSMMSRVPQRMRLGVVMVSMISIIVITVVGFNFGLADTILAGFGKDTTLTGRTYLWQEGFKIGLERPFLGHGYSAFWVVGQKQAERYWYEFDIPGRMGFHFHELFIQTFVDLGAIGFLLMVILILAGFLKSCARVIRSGPELELMILLAISTMFVIRAFVEVDFLGPFGIGDLLFFFVIPRLAAYQRRLDYEKSENEAYKPL